MMQHPQMPSPVTPSAEVQKGCPQIAKSIFCKLGLVEQGRLWLMQLICSHLANLYDELHVLAELAPSWCEFKLKSNEHEKDSYLRMQKKQKKKTVPK